MSGYNYIGPAGRIAGDVWGNCGTDAYHMQHYRTVENTMRPYPEIAANWAENGITPDKWVAFYCGTGWRASETWLYAMLMGLPRAAVYDGGWFEWSMDPVSNPIEIGDPTGPTRTRPRPDPRTTGADGGAGPDRRWPRRSVGWSHDARAGRTADRRPLGLRSVASGRTRVELSREQVLAHGLRVSGLAHRLPAGWNPCAARRRRACPTACLAARSCRSTPGSRARNRTLADPALVQVWGPRFSAYVIAAGDRAVFTLGRMPDAAGRVPGPCRSPTISSGSSPAGR